MPTPFHKLNALFEQAVDLPAPERDQFVSDLDETGLRDELRALLHSHETAGHFLGSVEIDLAAKRPQVGFKIGPYTLVRFLGEGGCGLVFAAEQSEPITRTVALKLIKPEVGSGSMFERFQRERRILARLHHPGIAALFEASHTEDGTPYFVMECIEGSTITHYCDDTELGLRERITLFRKVCAAVQHAHENGILHCDIKPANVLVDPTLDESIPKIIDFGIARSRHERVANSEQLGTRRYMSPELLHDPTREPDTRSEVYALGAVLYELLTGKQAFNTRAADAAVEAEPAQKTGRAETGLPRDLDAILAKALHPEPDQRYASVRAFSDDLDRHLHHRPVQARPPRFGYRLGKFMRRNRGPCAAAALLTLALLLGSFGSVLGFFRASRQAAEARHQAATAQAAADFLGGVILRADPYGEADPALRALLHTLTQEAGTRLAAFPEVEAQVRVQIAHVQFAESLYLPAESNLIHAAQGLDRVDKPATELRIEIHHLRGVCALAQFKIDEAIEQLQRGLETGVAQFGEAHPDVLKSRIVLAQAYWREGSMTRSRQQLDRVEALLDASAVQNPESGNRDLRHKLLRERYRLACAEKQLGEALRLCRARLALYEEEGKPMDDPQVSFTRAELAQTLGKAGEPEKALMEMRAVLKVESERFGQNHPVALDRQVDLAYLLHQTGQRDEALATVQAVLTRSVAAFGEEHRIAHLARNALASFGSE